MKQISVKKFRFRERLSTLLAGTKRVNMRVRNALILFLILSLMLIGGVVFYRHSIATILIQKQLAAFGFLQASFSIDTLNWDRIRILNFKTDPAGQIQIAEFIVDFSLNSLLNKKIDRIYFSRPRLILGADSLDLASLGSVMRLRSDENSSSDAAIANIGTMNRGQWRATLIEIDAGKVIQNSVKSNDTDQTVKQDLRQSNSTAQLEFSGKIHNKAGISATIIGNLHTESGQTDFTLAVTKKIEDRYTIQLDFHEAYFTHSTLTSKMIGQMQLVGFSGLDSDFLLQGSLSGKAVISGAPSVAFTASLEGSAKQLQLNLFIEPSILYPGLDAMLLLQDPIKAPHYQLKLNVSVPRPVEQEKNGRIIKQENSKKRPQIASKTELESIKVHMQQGGQLLIEGTLPPIIEWPNIGPVELIKSISKGSVDLDITNLSLPNIGTPIDLSAGFDLLPITSEVNFEKKLNEKKSQKIVKEAKKFDPVGFALSAAAPLRLHIPEFPLQKLISFGLPRSLIEQYGISSTEKLLDLELVLDGRDSLPTIRDEDNEQGQFPLRSVENSLLPSPLTLKVQQLAKALHINLEAALSVNLANQLAGKLSLSALAEMGSAEMDSEDQPQGNLAQGNLAQSNLEALTLRIPAFHLNLPELDFNSDLFVPDSDIKSSGQKSLNIAGLGLEITGRAVVQKNHFTVDMALQAAGKRIEFNPDFQLKDMVANIPLIVNGPFFAPENTKKAANWTLELPANKGRVEIAEWSLSSFDLHNTAPLSLILKAADDAALLHWGKQHLQTGALIIQTESVALFHYITADNPMKRQMQLEIPELQLYLEPMARKPNANKPNKIVLDQFLSTDLDLLPPAPTPKLQFSAILDDAVLSLIEPKIKATEISATVHFPLLTKNTAPELDLKIGTIIHQAPLPLFAPLSFVLEAQPSEESQNIDLYTHLAIREPALTVIGTGSHNWATKKGMLDINMAPLMLGKDEAQLHHLIPGLVDKTLSRHINKGSLELGGSLGWQQGTFYSDLALILYDMNLSLPGLSLKKLNTVMQIEHLFPFGTRKQQRLSIGVLNLGGLPLTNGLLNYQINSGSLLEVESALFSIAGGRIRVEPMAIELTKPELQTTLKVENIDLEALIKLAALKSLAVTGKLNGSIPLHFVGETFEINNGILTTDKAGRLSYQPDTPPPGLASAGQSVALMLQALSNFEYDFMEVLLNRQDNETVTAQFVVNGANPDFYNGYPVKLTVSVSGNLDAIIHNTLRDYGTPQSIRTLQQHYGQ